MAKFLPFVVEKSTPIHVYQTLISRSKGLNNLLVTSILYMVVEKGITEIRSAAAELPNMNLNQLYEQLLNAYPSYRITIEQYNKVQSVRRHLTPSHNKFFSSELRDYEASDIMNFLLVMVLTGKLDKYSQLRFQNLFNGEAEKAEISLTDTGLFSENGDEYIFSSKEDLAGYIWLYECILPTDSKTQAVRAVYMDKGNYEEVIPNAYSGGSSARGGSKTRFDAPPKKPPPHIPPNGDVPWESKDET